MPVIREEPKKSIRYHSYVPLYAIPENKDIHLLARHEQNNRTIDIRLSHIWYSIRERKQPASQIVNGFL